ncbi:MAG: Lhr family helicase, partial [Acidimicrobiales bacterium]
RFEPDSHVEADALELSTEDVVVDAVRATLDSSPPLTTGELAESIGIGRDREAEVRSAIASLEHEGSVLSCRVGDDTSDRYSARYLLMRIHAGMREQGRRSIETFTPADLMAFLVSWQHAGPADKLTGKGGVAEVIEQLQGFEAPIEAWEAAILPARVSSYQPGMLDELCNEGEIGFGRLGIRQLEGAPEVTASRRPGIAPSRSTPVALFHRGDLDWLLASLRGGARPLIPTLGAPADVLAALAERGALFLTDLCSVTGRMPVEVADALWEGISRGLVTADGFQAVRSLLGGHARLGNLVRHNLAGSAEGLRSRSGRPVPRPQRGSPRPRVRPARSGGRWSLLGALANGTTGPGDTGEYDTDDLAESLAGQLLQRWGIVFRDLVQRELMGIGWREVLWALRRLEARGIVRGGRFVTGFTGEQFALPEAYERLRASARSERDGSAVRLSAADPLNLSGVIVPGPRIPAVRTRSVVISDGTIAAAESVSAGSGALAVLRPTMR